MRDDGGPAFPMNSNTQTCGMSLREWYAGQALVGILAGKMYMDVYPLEEPGKSVAFTTKVAFEYADAMIAEAMK